MPPAARKRIPSGRATPRATLPLYESPDWFLESGLLVGDAVEDDDPLVGDVVVVVFCVTSVAVRCASVADKDSAEATDADAIAMTSCESC